MTHITQLPLCWNSFQKSPKHLSVPLPYFRCIRNFPKAFAPLSVPPYGSGELQTWSRPLSDQWSTGCSGKQCWPLCSPRCWFIVEPLNIVSYSLCIRYLFVRDPILVSTILLFDLVTDKHINSFPWHYISSWPSHMLASLMDVTVTEWAQSIYPSRGHTNPDLDTCAST